MISTIRLSRKNILRDPTKNAKKPARRQHYRSNHKYKLVEGGREDV